MPDVITHPARLDMTRYIRPGDTVAWSQACAEPLTLTECLVAQRAQLGSLRCFLGIPASRTVGPQHADHLSFLSYCGSGSNRALYGAGALDIVPCHYSELPGLLARGPLRADVLLLQLAPADEDGNHSLGLAHDYLAEAVDTARVVIAEVNDQVPRTRGPRVLSPASLDVVVHTSRPPAELALRPADMRTARIAVQVAELVEDGATLQFGVGTLPEAVLRQLHGHRRLGVHSGMLSEDRKSVV